MPVVFHALRVQHFPKFVADNACAVQKFFFCAHGHPLERGEWLWYKERGAGNDLYTAVPLLLRDLVIAGRDLVAQDRNAFHVVDGLRGKSQHKVQFYTGTACVERLAGTIDDILFR